MLYALVVLTHTMLPGAHLDVHDPRPLPDAAACEKRVMEMVGIAREMVAQTNLPRKGLIIKPICTVKPPRG